MPNDSQSDNVPRLIDFNDKIWAWYDISAGESLSFDAENVVMLFFVMQGKVTVSDSDGNTRIMRKSSFFLKPMGVGLDMAVPSISVLPPPYAQCADCESVRVVACRFHPYTSKCVNNFLRRVIGWKNQVLSGSACGPVVLTATEQVSAFLSSLVRVLSENSFRIDFCLLKLEELFIYLETYYERDSLRALFHPLLGMDIEFVNSVMDCYRMSKSVDEMASKLKMSRVTFNRHFSASFGMTASRWLRNMRNMDLLKLIVSTDTSFTEIAYDMGFSSSAYLTEYCRKNWGKTPTQLRAEGCDMRVV